MIAIIEQQPVPIHGDTLYLFLAGGYITALESSITTVGNLVPEALS